MTPLRIGTRGSQLALWQARHVAGGLEARSLSSEIVPIRTSGDRLVDAPLSAAGGKRLFVREIEEALLDGRADLAVHSAKDMPVDLPDGLALAALLPREDPLDVVVLPAGESGSIGLDDVIVRAPGLRVGTSSVRRIAQLSRLMPGARFLPIRGNLDTRLRKIDAGEYDALVLAAAGLERLGAGSRIACAIPVTACVPAPGQGAIGIEVRADDRRALDAVAHLNDRATEVAVTAERALVRALGGGCQMPIGALALAEDDALVMHAAVLSLDGRHEARVCLTGPAADPASLGRRAAATLIDAGARAILDGMQGD
jgi:hydroxymethylbilane synthase